eukprot:1816643-Amphidinium_carterae.1
MLLASRILTRAAVTEKPIEQCRLRAVFDFSYVGKLICSSFAKRLDDRWADYGPVMQRDTPLLMSKEMWTLAEKTPFVARIDIKHCDHMIMRWMSEVSLAMLSRKLVT